MADELSIALLDLLRKADPVERTDFVRQAVEHLAQAIIEVEVEQKVGAARYERTETRNNSRNWSFPGFVDRPPRGRGTGHKRETGAGKGLPRWVASAAKVFAAARTG
jgi:hypothetical protein